MQQNALVVGIGAAIGIGGGNYALVDVIAGISLGGGVNSTGCALNGDIISVPLIGIGQIAVLIVDSGSQSNGITCRENVNVSGGSQGDLRSCHFPGSSLGSVFALAPTGEEVAGLLIVADRNVLYHGGGIRHGNCIQHAVAVHIGQYPTGVAAILGQFDLCQVSQSHVIQGIAGVLIGDDISASAGVVIMLGNSRDSRCQITVFVHQIVNACPVHEDGRTGVQLTVDSNRSLIQNAVEGAGGNLSVACNRETSVLVGAIGIDSAFIVGNSGILDPRRGIVYIAVDQAIGGTVLLKGTTIEFQNAMTVVTMGFRDRAVVVLKVERSTSCACIVVADNGVLALNLDTVGTGGRNTHKAAVGSRVTVNLGVISSNGAAVTGGDNATLPITGGAVVVSGNRVVKCNGGVFKQENSVGLLADTIIVILQSSVIQGRVGTDQIQNAAGSLNALVGGAAAQNGVHFTGPDSAAVQRDVAEGQVREVADGTFHVEHLTGKGIAICIEFATDQSCAITLTYEGNIITGSNRAGHGNSTLHGDGHTIADGYVGNDIAILPNHVLGNGTGDGFAVQNQIRSVCFLCENGYAHGACHHQHCQEHCKGLFEFLCHYFILLFIFSKAINETSATGLS